MDIEEEEEAPILREPIMTGLTLKNCLTLLRLGGVSFPFREYMFLMTMYAHYLNLRDSFENLIYPY